MPSKTVTIRDLRRVFPVVLLVLLWAGASSSRAASVSLNPVADTSLMEPFEVNNLGGAIVLLVGTGENLARHRALLRFDIAGTVPTGSRVTSATLVLELVGLPSNGYVQSGMSLHRVLQPWGEGNKLSPTNCTSCLGQGSAATTNEATWLNRFAFTTNTWGVPGGAATNDYAAEVSSSQVIYQFGGSPYSFNSSDRMVADIQAWLDNPQTSFGWMLIANAEAVAFTARRFASREDANSPPILSVDFVPPPQILSVARQNNQFTLTFAGEGGQSYFVEYRDSVLTNVNWNLLTNIGVLAATADVIVTDSLPPSNPNRFYRVGLQ